MAEEVQLQQYGVATAELAVARSAEIVFKEAEMVSRPWALRVEKLKLYKTIGTSKHLYIEAWQMIGACYRVTPRIVETRFLDYGEVRGFEATAEAYHVPTGSVLSRADAMCMSDEDNWGPRTKYEYQGNEKVPAGFAHTPLQQLRSMAQTRAQSKVLSNLFKWVARMNGYQGTPAEEMTGKENDSPPVDPGATAPPQRRSQGSQSQGNGTSAPVISEPQSKRMYAIARGGGLDDDGYKRFLEQYGFQHGKDVTRDKYESMCARLEEFRKASEGQQ